MGKGEKSKCALFLQVNRGVVVRKHRDGTEEKQAKKNRKRTIESSDDGG